MLHRVIACLDVRGDRVVKGRRFVSLRDVGDPLALAQEYEAQGADEIVFLDISATPEERALLLDMARRTAERLFIPLTIGGGIRSVEDAGLALRSGADKISINSAAVVRPALLTECAERFGSQCVVASIDARREAGGYRVVTRGGRTATTLDAIEWARDCVAHGAGEILLTSIDHDGGRTGYDLALTRAVADTVPVPVIASGGAGAPEDACEAIRLGHADAILVAGILHDHEVTIAQIKDAMARDGIAVRRVA